MGEYFVGLAGTPEGESLAFILALTSALAHAIFAAINKGGTDPYLNRGAINICYSIMAAPFALYIFPLPEKGLIHILFLSYLFHLTYEWFQAAAYNRGAFTLVYPIARGTTPIITTVIAIFLFSETLEPNQWVGMILLSCAIMSLAAINLRDKGLSTEIQSELKPSILLALCAGVAIAGYTTIDAYGIRETANPFTFLAWFFFLGGFGFPLVAAHRWQKMEVKPRLRPLIIKGIIGAVIALFSFAMLMLATRIGKVSEAAALRETSIIFATIIGVIFFREKVSPLKLLAIMVIVAGAVMIEFH
jgi:drug/metabolite transporter (DMT)-like permease